ncbi:SdpI family protein [Microbacterium maritypicum]
MLELITPVLIAAVGALVVWYADACRRGTVRRQRILGYRTALTLRDPKAWIAVHRAVAPLLYIAGGGAVLAGMAGAALALFGITAAVPFVLGGAVVWLLLCTVLSGLPGAAAARGYRGLGDRTTAK